MQYIDPYAVYTTCSISLVENILICKKSSMTSIF